MRPESYRNVERCCATCRFFFYSRRISADACSFGGTPSETSRMGDFVVHEHGICDEYQPEPPPCDA